LNRRLEDQETRSSARLVPAVSASQLKIVADKEETDDQKGVNQQANYEKFEKLHFS
jgi:hypothetical protein